MDLNKSTLQSLHTEKLQQGCHINENCVNQLIDIFGGPDAVFSILLSSNETILDTKQLTQIHKLLIQPSKYVIALIFVLAILVPFLIKKTQIIETNDTVILLYCCIAVPLEILYFLFHVLSVNKRCFILIVSTFDFWFKLFYGMQFVIGTCIYWNMSLFIGIEIGIATFLIIILLSLSDGLQFRLHMNVIFGVTISIYYTIIALYYNNIKWNKYTETEEERDMIVNITNDISISVIAMLRQSSQILALFFWRTTILSVIKKKKCSLISYSPYIKWERYTNIK